MSIWMDMTNSLVTWKGGIVGIVRAELEIAKGLHDISPNIKFCAYEKGKYRDVSNELDWLWNADSVSDAYLEHYHRVPSKKKENHTVVRENIYDTPQWNNAMSFSPNRIKRFAFGMFMYFDAFPKFIAFFLKVLFILLVCVPLQIMAYAVSMWRKFTAKCKSLYRNTSRQETVKHEEIQYPFSEGDSVFSCGWHGSGKEVALRKAKDELTSFTISYLIYDTILINEGVGIFYPEPTTNAFEEYLQWALLNCDYIFTGGATASKDVMKYCEEKGLKVKPTFPVKFGSDVIDHMDGAIFDGEELLKKYKISRKYVITVGTLDRRKNYDTLYRAFDLLSSKLKDECPTLVIVGKNYGDCYDFVDTVTRDPNVKDKIVIVTPSDEELRWLYEHALFSCMASAYEGWSLTLPEALNYGKFVLAANNEPLRECGGDFCEYIDTFDPYAWAERIEYYVENLQLVKEREKYIKEKYTRITWSDTSSSIFENLSKNIADNSKPLYFDVTLTCNVALYAGCRISGILRTELMLLKNLHKYFDNIIYVAYHDGIIRIDSSCFEYILTGKKLDEDYLKCRDRIIAFYTQNTVIQSLSPKWLLATSVLPGRVSNYFWKKKQCEPTSTPNLTVGALPNKCNVKGLESGVLLQCAPIGDPNYLKCIEKLCEKGTKLCCIVYDFTPVCVPQTHQMATVKTYIPYLEYVYKNSAYILYGGENARNDSKKYLATTGLPNVPSVAIKFGSDISFDIKNSKFDMKEEDILTRLGVNGDYILAVGTIEQRKNYETLYRSYVRLVSEYDDADFPQLVIAGHPGWKTKDFLSVYHRDERVHEKMIFVEPNDYELDVLYRNCEFTVLASIYEGWSLTLPESMRYGKFCLCCDTPALRETAGDLSEYIGKWDEVKWADRISYYHRNSDILKEKEKDIKNRWKTIKWDDCAHTVADSLKKLMYGTVEDGGDE